MKQFKYSTVEDDLHAWIQIMLESFWISRKLWNTRTAVQTILSRVENHFFMVTWFTYFNLLRIKIVIIITIINLLESMDAKSAVERGKTEWWVILVSRVESKVVWICLDHVVFLSWSPNCYTEYTLSSTFLTCEWGTEMGKPRVQLEWSHYFCYLVTYSGK